jgi:glycosyltransferase involved in cell wall biosynthesis
MAGLGGVACLGSNAVSTAAPRTLVIIPALDEEAALPRTLAELRTAQPGLDVLVVDDGSTDRTVAAARAGGARVARLPFHLGIGCALRAGFRYALAEGYDRAVQVDADGQHDPAEIGTLLAALDEGADMVIGSRFASGSAAYEVGRLRKRAMSLLRLTVRLLSGRSFTDTSSGFRAFDRRTIEYFARNYPAEYMESVEALMMACYVGLRVAEVPTKMRERSAGQPSNRRWRLVYHYVRLYVVLLSSATPRRPVFQEAAT